MPKSLIFLLGISMVALFGTIDLLIKNEILFTVFYLLPVTLVAWFAGWRFAIVASIMSVIMLFADDISSRLIPVTSITLYWDFIGRLGFFLIISYTLATLKNAYDALKELALIDPLTELSNSRSFYEMANKEIERAKRFRYALTIGFIDLDNFKSMNDTYGHPAGDYIIRKVAESIQDSIRSIDFAARMGGDEFVVMLSRAEKQESVKIIKRIQTTLAEKMKKHRWTLTFSVGMVTYHTMHLSLDEMISAADKLMYKVKAKGKNNVLHEVQ